VSTSPLRTFSRFGAVGAGGAVLNMFVFGLLTSAHMPAIVAAPIAFEVALASNFVLHRRWTFDASELPPGVAFLRYQAAAMGGLLLQLLVLHALTSFGIPPLLGNLVGIAAATAWNFTLSLRWTFPTLRLAPSA
jgi:putative flippase GtrA